jgi:hypothetical protein
MTKLEARIVRDIFQKGSFTAVSQKQFGKAQEVLNEVLPHRSQSYEVTDESQKFGAFVWIFRRTL